MSEAPFIRQQENDVLLAIRLQPRASRDEIGPPHGDELKVKVTAPPVNSAANNALLKLLSKKLRCPKSNIELVHGHTSRQKTIRIQNTTAETVLERLS